MDGLFEIGKFQVSGKIQDFEKYQNNLENLFKIKILENRSTSKTKKERIFGNLQKVLEREEEEVKNKLVILNQRLLGIKPIKPTAMIPEKVDREAGALTPMIFKLFGGLPEPAAVGAPIAAPAKVAAESDEAADEKVTSFFKMLYSATHAGEAADSDNTSAAPEREVGKKDKGRGRPEPVGDKSAPESKRRRSAEEGPAAVFTRENVFRPIGGAGPEKPAMTLGR
jgi:hypothetical protein